MDKGTMDKLSAFYRRNRVLKNLIDIIAGGQFPSGEDIAEMSVETVAEITFSPREEVIGVMKKLESLGAGRFIRGRRGKKSRFQWGTKDVFRLARNISSTKEHVHKKENRKEEDIAFKIKEMLADFYNTSIDNIDVTVTVRKDLK